MASDAADLLSAARLFLLRHDEALRSDDPGRVETAARGLLEGLPALREQVAGLGSQASRPEARRVVEKRVAECEGALLHLALAASNARVAGAPVDVVARFASETHLARRALAGLSQALSLWTGEAPPRPEARAALRAARECLLAGLQEAAAACLAKALPAGLAQPFPDAAAGEDLERVLSRWAAAGREPPEGAAACREAMRRLGAGARDPVEAWALLDLVERVVDRASMVRLS